MELGRGRGPPCAGPSDSRYDDAAVFGMQLDLAREASLLEQGLRNTDALGVANCNDPPFNGRMTRHSSYNVATIPRTGKSDARGPAST